MIRFTWLTGDMNWADYGGKWISQKLNNGDFDYFLVLEVWNWFESVGAKEAKYNVSLSIVSPSQDWLCQS